jgi:hypothetical protein
MFAQDRSLYVQDTQGSKPESAFVLNWMIRNQLYEESLPLFFGVLIIQYIWIFPSIDAYGLHEPPSQQVISQEHFATSLFAREYLADTTTSTTHPRSYRTSHTHPHDCTTSRNRQHPRTIARWTSTATELPRPPLKEAEKTHKSRSRGAVTPLNHRARTPPPIRGASTPRRLERKRK